MATTAPEESGTTAIAVDAMLNGSMAMAAIDASTATSAASPALSDSNIIRGITNAQSQLIGRIIIPLNALSIIGALVVIFCIFYLRWRHRRLADRVSLRLTLGIAIGDALFSTFQVLGALHKTDDDWWCSMCAWGYVETTLFSVFLTMCIAFNLHAVFVHSAHPGPSWEFWYFIVAIVGSFCASLPPWIIGVFGHDNAERTCWFRGAGTRSILVWQWASLFGWLALAVVYCVVAVAAVAWKLLREQALAREDDDDENRQYRGKYPSRRGLPGYLRDKGSPYPQARTANGHHREGELPKRRTPSTAAISPRCSASGMLEHAAYRRIAIEVPEGHHDESMIIPVAIPDDTLELQHEQRHSALRSSGQGSMHRRSPSTSNSEPQRDEEMVVVQMPASMLRASSASYGRYRPRPSNSAMSPSSPAGCLGIKREQHAQQQSPKMHQMIRRVAGRIVLYPLVPILTQTLTIASEIDTYIHGSVRFGLYLASYVAASCPGLLNALAFIVFDPAVHNILRVVREDLLTQYRARRDSGQLGWSGQVALWALHGGQIGEVAEERARRRSARISADFMSFGLYRDELEAAAERSRQLVCNATAAPRTACATASSAQSGGHQPATRPRRRSATSGETPRGGRPCVHRRYRSFSGSSSTNDSSTASIQQAYRQKIGFGMPMAIAGGSLCPSQGQPTSAQSHDDANEFDKPAITAAPAPEEETGQDEGDASWVTTTLGSSSAHGTAAASSWQPPATDATSRQRTETDLEEAEANELDDQVPAMVSFTSLYHRSRHASRASLSSVSGSWREAELAYSDIFAPLSASSVPVHEILRLAQIHVRRASTDGHPSVSMASRSHSTSSDSTAPIFNLSHSIGSFSAGYSPSIPHHHQHHHHHHQHHQPVSDTYPPLSMTAPAITVSTPRAIHASHGDPLVLSGSHGQTVMASSSLFSDLSAVHGSESSLEAGHPHDAAAGPESSHAAGRARRTSADYYATPAATAMDMPSHQRDRSSSLHEQQPPYPDDDDDDDPMLL
ncbi:hypothetical protein SYNPS1DRAFT_27846, partial [Syncephalis pseudoplumigaleata]